MRVLTWRRDWVNLIWALKSFYFFSQVRYPLFIHDGGLLPNQVSVLQTHFPSAVFVKAVDADDQVERVLQARSLRRCASYRMQNPASRKLFDYAVLSKATRIIGIDSDIIFLARPTELIDDVDRISRFNRDMAYAYSIPIEKVRSLAGTAVPAFINSGLFAIDHASIDLGLVEEWLADEALFSNRWVTEQTLHAMLAARYGVQLLPQSYLVDVNPGLPAGLICKHYPGFYRPLLYHEGMRRVASSGFLATDKPASRSRLFATVPEVQ